MNTDIHMATSIRLSEEAEQRLDFLAAQTGRTKAFYLRQMIENGLDDLEDYYLAAKLSPYGVARGNAWYQCIH